MSCDQLFIPEAFWGACNTTRAKPAEPAVLLPDPRPPGRTQRDVKQRTAQQGTRQITVHRKRQMQPASALRFLIFKVKEILLL